jgi:hypothetical protein
MPIKAISLLEPWASLLMLPSSEGGKSIETRSWETKYRGTIAIHASKNFRPGDRDLCEQPYFKEALAKLGYRHWSELPLGCVIGTAELVRTFQFDGNNTPPYPERAFGDYSLGRYGFVLVRPRRLVKPIPASGSLSLWDWTPPAELAFLNGSTDQAISTPAETGLFG